MKTNYQQILIIKTYWEENKATIKRGFVNAEQVRFIKETCEINEKRDFLSLRNLRDFAVCFLSRKIDVVDDIELELLYMDCISAITAVIDDELWKRGAEV